MSFASEATDAIHGTAGAVAAFVRSHPDETVIASAATKAVRSDRPEAPSRGMGWVTSRRSSLIVSSQRLACGDWDIPIAEIASAELLSFRSVLSRGLLLRVETTGGVHYQFGLRDAPIWAAELPFPVTRGSTRLALSPVSLGLRIVALGLIVWSVGDQLGWW